MEELKNAIESALLERYGESTNRGCYINGAWLSVEAITMLIFDIINIYGHLFIDEENATY